MAKELAKKPNKWAAKLRKEMDGAVQERGNPFDMVVRTSSPSFNRAFGKTHGLPRGYTAIFWGPWKGGKSLITKSLIADALNQDKTGESIALLFDTEYRAEAQLPTDADYAKFGIDPDRLVIVQTNSPEGVFNQMCSKVKALMQEGMPLVLVVLDSASSMLGRRTEKNYDINKQTIGDLAATLGDGMKMLLPIIRDNKIALAIITQARDEFDQWVQRRNGHKFRMQAAAGLKHLVEYFFFMEEDETSKGNTDVFKQDIRGASKKAGEKQKWRVRGKLERSSMGPSGRTFSFTFDRSLGFVDQWEEIAKMGLKSRVVEVVGNTHTFGPNSWSNGKSYYTAVRDDMELQRAITAEVLRRDTLEENTAFEEEELEEDDDAVETAEAV